MIFESKTPLNDFISENMNWIKDLKTILLKNQCGLENYY